MNPVRQQIRTSTLAERDCPVTKVMASLSLAEQSWVDNVQRDHARHDVLTAEMIRLEDKIIATLYGQFCEELIELRRDIRLALIEAGPGVSFQASMKIDKQISALIKRLE